MSVKTHLEATKATAKGCKAAPDKDVVQTLSGSLGRPRVTVCRYGSTVFCVWGQIRLVAQAR